VAWLLVLAGPLGWPGLLVIGAVRQGEERITVTVPFRGSAYMRMRQRSPP
jgi:hypothetical protein